MTRKKPGCLPIVEAERAAACDSLKGSITNEEAAVLAAMRELKAEVSELKRRRRQAEDDGDEATLADLGPRLNEARQRWRELEQERDAARHRRMVMLGHASA